MTDRPKRIKRLMREYAATAHEEELRRALLPISEAFGRWARRELGSGEISEIIHRFHQGPARELWVRYNTLHPEMTVAFAITTGVLGREAIPAELLEHLAGALRFYEESERGEGQVLQAGNRRNRLDPGGARCGSHVSRQQFGESALRMLQETATKSSKGKPSPGARRRAAG